MGKSIIALTRVAAAMLATTAVLLVGTSNATAATTATATYGQYSMMDQLHAGQFWADGAPAGQWAWTPNGVTSDVAWGNPALWPPLSAERFVRSGSWVLLDGWRDNGTYYTQRVTSEYLGDGNCRNLKAIPSDGGRQHYVQWTVPSGAYCLKATGTITEQLTGKVVTFTHTQIWSPPSSCRNAYLGAQTCITQRETWSDNNGNLGGPVTLKLDRSMQLARGIGPAFTVRQTFPSKWNADLFSHWSW